MKNKQILAGALVGIVSVVVLSGVVVQKRLHDLKTYVEEEIAKQTTIVTELAVETGRGGTNTKIAAIVPACESPSAVRYDTLLSSLDKGLSAYQLQELTVLFKQCGAIPATRRAGMTLLLEREVQSLADLMQQRSLLGGYPIEETNLSKWQTLAEKERQLSALFLKLVDAQKQIIGVLTEGEMVTGKSVSDIQTVAKALQDQMTAATAEAFEVRADLIAS